LPEEPPPEERARFWGHLGAETARMLWIVERLLVLTTLENGVMSGTRGTVAL
jgi:hypothetical protein